MWGSVAVLALPIAFDPVRLGVNLLLISRPRPAQNLLVYWVGCVTASVMLLLLPLLALHFTDLAWVHDLANPRTTASATMRHVQVFVGVLLLVIAAVTAMRMVTRRRAPDTDASPSRNCCSATPTRRHGADCWDGRNGPGRAGRCGSPR